MLVTAEATPSAPGGGHDLVFRLGEEHFLYRAGKTGVVQLVDEDYAFSENAPAWHDVESSFTAAPAGTPGDYNDDGHVDDQDKAVWRASYGSWSVTSSLAADGNRDGVVDAADYAVWRANLGTIAGDFDGNGAVARRYGLTPGHDAAVMVTDRFGEPRIWHVTGDLHDFPDHDALIAEARYLALTCSGGCSVPIWNDP